MTTSRKAFHAHWQAFLSGAALLALAACSSPEPLAELPQWRLVEEWRVGGEADGPHSFDFNLGLGLLPKGGFVHFDYKSSKLHYLDAQGEVVRSVGRAGRGPGEFMMVNGLAVASDGRVIISDLVNGFSIFSDSGAFIRVIKPDAGRLGIGKRWDAIVLADGRIVENLEQVPGRPGGEPLRLVWSSDLMHADTLPSASCAAKSTGPATRIPLKDSTGKLLINSPLSNAEPRKATAVDVSGSTWEQLDRARGEIVRHGLNNCEVMLTINLPGAPESFDPAAKAMMVEMVKEEAKRWKAMEPEFGALPDQGAWYQGLYLDPAGNVWVERVGANRNFRVEIYSADAKPVAEVRDKSLPVFPMITATHVYGLARGEDDVHYLVAWRLEKGG